MSSWSQATLFGFPHDATAHQRRAANARPRRAPSGEALLFVLSRLEGESTVDEIAEQLETQSDLFKQPGAAAQFVRQAAERYGA